MAASYQAGVTSLGDASYTALQLAQVLAASGLKLVPDVVLGDGRANLADVLLAKMATGHAPEVRMEPQPVLTNGTH